MAIDRIEELYLEAINKARKIKFDKIHDYNNGLVRREDYYLFGPSSLVNELWKKMLRIISIYTSGEKPKCEKLEDTLLDIINYSADFYSYLRYTEENKQKEEREKDELRRTKENLFRRMRSE
jgi:hypothetical protein